MATQVIAGEEWRNMDGSGTIYNSPEVEAVLATARRQIPEIRQRAAEIRLVDRAGRPLPGVELDIEQTRNAFPFGDQLWSLDAMARHGDWSTDRARYWRERFCELFNAATNLCYWTERPRNDGSKTEDLQGEPRIENFATTVDWTVSRGLTAKGHPLFWSIPKCTPEWVKRYDIDTFMKFAEVRVRNLVARFKGRVTIWDAVNEPMWEAAPKHLAQRDWPHLESTADIVEYIAPVIRWCREEDPDATYLVNDYGMETTKPNLKAKNGTVVTADLQRRRFLDVIAALADVGAAPNAIGLQSHTGWFDPAGQWKEYDQFATSGLPVHITEFWANVEELRSSGRYSDEAIEQIRAEYVANFLTTAFGHPAVEGFFFWGLINATVTWFDTHSGHETTPTYDRIRRLIHEEWRTRTTARTDADGVARFRGFFGDYAARWRAPGAGGWIGRGFRLDPAAAMPLTLAAVPPPTR